jgi:hypothetical protein
MAVMAVIVALKILDNKKSVVLRLSDNLKKQGKPVYAKELGYRLDDKNKWRFLWRLFYADD